jgi:hypothetical protein
MALLLIGAAAQADSAGSGIERSLVSVGPLPTPWQGQVWRQVRIERHFSIRITPGTASMPPSVIEEMEEEDRIEPRAGRKISKCVSVSSIAALRPGDGDEMLLFLHDDRIIRATLDKRCSARDFYSGFYIERNADGAICTGRDILHSRSGANCKVRRLHELVSTGYRRFP